MKLATEFDELAPVTSRGDHHSLSLSLLPQSLLAREMEESAGRDKSWRACSRTPDFMKLAKKSDESASGFFGLVSHPQSLPRPFWG